VPGDGLRGNSGCWIVHAAFSNRSLVSVVSCLEETGNMASGHSSSLSFLLEAVMRKLHQLSMSFTQVLMEPDPLRRGPFLWAVSIGTCVPSSITW